jgi:hypothetical protein
MFSIFPPSVSLFTGLFEFLGRLPRQFFGLRGCLVGVFTCLMSRLIGLFFPRATIVCIYGAVASRGADQQAA